MQRQPSPASTEQTDQQLRERVPEPPGQSFPTDLPQNDILLEK